MPAYSTLYAELATSLVTEIVDSGTPYLPADVFLNVNFPAIAGNCTDPAAFQWILSRINPGFLSPADVEWCGSTRLPTEDSVEDTDGCYISVSVGSATSKATANSTQQAEVLAKLKNRLVCLP